MSCRKKELYSCRLSPWVFSETHVSLWLIARCLIQRHVPEHFFGGPFPGMLLFNMSQRWTANSTSSSFLHVSLSIGLKCMVLQPVAINPPPNPLANPLWFVFFSEETQVLFTWSLVLASDCDAHFAAFEPSCGRRPAPELMGRCSRGHCHPRKISIRLWMRMIINET